MPVPQWHKVQPAFLCILPIHLIVLLAFGFLLYIPGKLSQTRFPAYQTFLGSS